jgi:hypothetical protein
MKGIGPRGIGSSADRAIGSLSDLRFVIGDLPLSVFDHRFSIFDL